MLGADLQAAVIAFPGRAPGPDVGLHTASAGCEVLRCFLSCCTSGYFVKKYRINSNNLKNICNVLLLCFPPSNVEVCFLLTGITC